MAKKDPVFNVKSTSIRKLLNKKPIVIPFLIQFLIVAMKLMTLVSPGGVGKTQLSMQIAFSIATGIPFLGLFEVSDPGGVVIICTEETKEELVGRIKIILNHHLEGIEDKVLKKKERKMLKKLLKRRIRIAYVGADESFCLYPDDKTPSSVSRIKRFCNGLKHPPKLIITDNQSQLMLGEHNATSACGNIYEKAR